MNQYLFIYTAKNYYQKQVFGQCCLKINCKNKDSFTLKDIMEACDLISKECNCVNPIILNIIQLEQK